MSESPSDPADTPVVRTDDDLRAGLHQLASRAPAFRGLDLVATSSGHQVVGTRPLGRRRRAMLVGVVTSAALALAGVVLLGPLMLGSKGGDSTAVDPSVASAGQPTEIVRGRLRLPVPEGAQVVYSTACDGNGVAGDAVIVTDGPIDDCVHSHSRVLRIYVTSLAHPPFGEPWDTVTTPGPPVGDVETRRLTGDSSLGLSSATYVTALIAPQDDTAIVVAGAPTPAVAAQILASLH